MEILFFGPLTELSDKTHVGNEGIANTDQLKEKLEAIYPSISGIPYAIAINNQVVQGNMELRGDETVSLLPAFSGG